MARIRTIKPDFWTDGTMVGLSPWARLFYIGTWTFALCDHGHLPDDPVALKLRILPADPVDAQQLVDELIAAGRIVRRHLPDRRSYLVIPRLSDHQKLDARWSPRCPYCLAEPDGFTEDRPETPPNSPDTHPAAPEPAETPATTPQGSKGRDGKGRDVQHATRAAASRSSAADDTVTQRSKRITDAYAEIEPMCKWPAVNAIVIKAIKAGRWDDDEIRAAVLRLAAEGRGVTVETLRTELDGLPPGNGVAVRGARASPRPSATDRAVADALALKSSFTEEEP